MKLYFINESRKTTLLLSNNAFDAFNDSECRINLIGLMTFKATFLLNLFKGRYAAVIVIRVSIKKNPKGGIVDAALIVNLSKYQLITRSCSSS